METPNLKGMMIWGYFRTPPILSTSIMTHKDPGYLLQDDCSEQSLRAASWNVVWKTGSWLFQPLLVIHLPSFIREIQVFSVFLGSIGQACYLFTCFGSPNWVVLFTISQIVNFPIIHSTPMQVSINGGSPKWLVYSWKILLKLMMIWGYPLDLRKPPIHSASGACEKGKRWELTLHLFQRHVFFGIPNGVACLDTPVE